jgi:hypothetical protein
LNRRWLLRLVTSDRGKNSLIIRLPIERVSELAPGFTVEKIATHDFGRLYFQSVDDMDRLKPVLIAAAKDSAGIIDTKLPPLYLDKTAS